MRKLPSILILIFTCLFTFNLQTMQQVKRIKKRYFQAHEKKYLQAIDTTKVNNLINWSLHRIQLKKSRQAQCEISDGSQISVPSEFVYNRICTLYPKEVTVALPDIPYSNHQMMLMISLHENYLYFYISQIIKRALKKKNSDHIKKWLNQTSNYQELLFKIDSLISTTILYGYPDTILKQIYRTTMSHCKKHPAKRLLCYILMAKHHIYFRNNISFNIILKRIICAKNNTILNLKNINNESLIENFIGLAPYIYKKPIECLDLSENNLTKLPKIILKLQNIKSIYLHGNNLKELPEFLSHLPNLEVIIMDNKPYQKLKQPNSLVFDEFKTRKTIYRKTK